MLVGNDVVDLHDSESRPGALHPRFDVRVFTPDEREALSAAAYPLRWTLWAAKESAYKVAKKLDPTVRFLPRDFVVGQIAEGRALVMQGVSVQVSPVQVPSIQLLSAWRRTVPTRAGR